MENKKQRFIVVGDHPISAKSDRVFSGKNAEALAYVYASRLRDRGFENVKVKEAMDKEKLIEICRKLTDALERIRPVPERLLKKIPVRNLDEILAECDDALKTANDL